MSVLIFFLLPILCFLWALFWRPSSAGAGDSGEADSHSVESLHRQTALLQAANEASLLLFSDEDDFENLAAQALECIGTVTSADQVDVWRNYGSSDEGLLCTMLYEWHNKKRSGQYPSYPGTVVYDTHLPGWEAELASGQCINTLERAMSPQEEQHLHSHGLQAVLVAPIIFRSDFWGYIRLGLHSLTHTWGEGEESILRSVGLLLAGTLQRRQIQEALAESEERFRDVTMAAGEIVWELNAQGYFSYISARVHALTGYNPEELRGMRWEDLAGVPEEEGLTGRMFQASVPTGSFRALEHQIRTRDGKIVWLYSSGKLLLGPDGMAGLRGTSLDISRDKKNAENLNATLKALEIANKELETSAEHALELARKAESASKAKSEFLANMSHEVRTPLNAIIGMAYLMQKTDLSPKQEDYIGKIHTAGISLLGVVNDILDFSKIESGKLAVEHVAFEMGTMFENLAALVGAKADEQGLGVFLRIDRDVPRRLMGDPLRFSQVLTNIVSNSVKFTRQGGIHLRCSLDRREENVAHLRIQVRDTGIGISEEQQRTLFQSFSQGDSSITRKYGGTGLGLVISKNLLQIAGGSLSLESKQGVGTTVTVLVPLGIDSATPSRPIGPNDSVTDSLPVFLVEPDDWRRDSIREMLEELGCRAALFRDLEEAFVSLAATDSSGGPPRVLMLPVALAREHAADNYAIFQKNRQLINAPKVLALGSFGFMEEESGEQSRPPRNFNVVTCPLVSSSLEKALGKCLSSSLEDDGDAVEKEGAAPSAPYFPDCHVLLVEDNFVNQQIAVELLREVGISVTVADNGRIAVELLENSQHIPFDLIFMDLQMPEMDGLTATKKIRANPRLAHLPIIAMTAHATVEEQMHCLKVGMNQHVSKPIDVESLYESLRKWLNHAPAENAPPPACSDSASPLPGLLEPENDAAFLNELATLNSLLKDDDAAACTLFSKLEAQIRQNNAAAATAASKALAMFEFSQALSVLVPLENALAGGTGTGRTPEEG